VVLSLLIHRVVQILSNSPASLHPGVTESQPEERLNGLKSTASGLTKKNVPGRAASIRPSKCVVDFCWRPERGNGSAGIDIAPGDDPGNYSEGPAMIKMWRTLVLVLLNTFVTGPAFGQQSSGAGGNVGVGSNSGTIIIMPQGGSSGPTMAWQNNRWVKGDGNLGTIKGIGQPECSNRCLANNQCQFVEFYRPERACHFFSYIPTLIDGKDADVAIKR
jgi:hypothetical protein